MLALVKSRGGRPRRFPVDHEPREDVRSLPAWNRYRDHARELSLDPRLATQRGKLFWNKQLGEQEFEAANRFADMLEGYDMLVLGRRRTPASPSFERIGFGEGSERDPEAIEAFKGRFMDARKVLIDGGKLVESATVRLCRDEAGGAHLPDAKRGLGLLAVHFGLVKGRRR